MEVGRKTSARTGPDSGGSLPAGPRPTLFIIHARDERAGAEEIARAFGAAISGIPLAAEPDAADADEPRTVEGFAKRLAAEICARDPAGPYRLLGLGAAAALALAAEAELMGTDRPVDFAGTAGYGDGSSESAASSRLRRLCACWTPPPLPTSCLATFPSGGPAPSSALAAWVERQLRSRDGNAAASSPPSMLIPLKSGRRGHPPVFCVPGAGASVISFLDLVQVADEDLPVYGLQPRGLESNVLPYTSVEAAAAAMMALILQTAPTGPYHLIGHSYGGCIAFELAVRLRDRGHEICSLALIDTLPPRKAEWPDEYDELEVVMRWIELNEQAAERSMGIAIGDLSSSNPAANVRLVHERMVRVGLMPAQSAPSSLTGPMRMFGACMRTWYRPAKPYSGSLQLIYLDDPRFDAAGNEAAAEEMRAGWAAVAQGVDFRRGFGNHITGLRAPHAAHLASLLGLR